MVTHTLARKAGVDVPPAMLKKFNSEYHTFCVKRFDRIDTKRVFYASAMTMLKKSSSENSSYLDLAQAVQFHCAKGKIETDLEQLYRRVAFNVAVSNRDDHLRNHGFILTKDGWTLSQAFDINPNRDKTEHVLNIDDRDNRPSLETVISTAGFYRLDQARAEQIVEDVLNVVGTWKEVAKKIGVSAVELESLGGAFMLDRQPQHNWYRVAHL